MLKIADTEFRTPEIIRNPNEFERLEKEGLESINMPHLALANASYGNYKVYLAGPITGLDYKGAVDWREDAQKKLHAVGIVGVSPMRAKDYFKNIKEFSATCKGYEQYSCLSSARGIMTRDRWDATRCDVILVNFLGAQKASIGTIMEIAWADANRIPIVMVIEDQGNIHEHGMITEAIGFRVNNLDDAIEVIKGICRE